MLSVEAKTTENATAYIPPSPSPCTTLCIILLCLHVCLHFQPSRLISFLSTHNQSSLAFDLLLIYVMPFSVHTSAFCSLLKLVRSVADHICPPIDLSNLSAPLDTGVLTPPEAEGPRSPVSSSAPPSRRNITPSQRIPQRPSRPLSTSKTFTTSHTPSTTKGNGAMQSSNSFFPSSCSRFRPLFWSLITMIYGHI